MPKLKNEKEKIKKELTKLKGQYTGNPFDDNNMIKPDFMFFVVDYYIDILNKINKKINE